MTSPTFLNDILDSLPSTWDPLLADPDQYNLQIICTRVDRSSRNRPPLLTDFRFNVNNRRYFYPASTVKLPLAALALEKVNDLAAKGLTPRSRLQVTNTLPCQILYDHDDGAQPTNGVPIENSIKRMLLASDNGGYNRLWEFVTRDGANRRLAEAGFGEISLLHRLASGCSIEQNRISNPVACLDETGRVLLERGQVISLGPDVNPCAPVTFGRASMAGGRVEQHPFVADHLNYAPLESLHRFLIGMILPETVSPGQSLRLKADDYRLLRTWMELLPREAGMARYTPESGFPDRYKKYFLYGSRQEPIAEGLREFNVIGQAYGFVTDVAYLSGNDVEFFLSATIYTNANGIINDDIYEYESVAKPFFADLCRAIYDREKGRGRL